jgi:hypothetical protein
MTKPESDNPQFYRQRFFSAARNLYRSMKCLVFVYVVGTALAIVALSLTSGLGSANVNLVLVFTAYGVAGLASAIFIYAFVQLMILACCAYGEWLCETKQGAKPTSGPAPPSA